MTTSPADIFLSYSRADQAIARRFAEGLEREGFSVWWDQSLHSGEAYDKVTEVALRQAKAVVVLWSKASVESRWVRAEATTADRHGTLVPAMIEPCDRPIMFELTHTAELSEWKGDSRDPAWRAYLVDLRRAVERRATPALQTPAGTATSAAASLRGAAPGRPALVIAVLVAMLLGGALVWSLLRKPAPERPVPDAAAASATTSATQPVTLAVLPFADLSEAKDQEYFSDGLTEEILNQLAQVQGMRVTGRTSSFSFKGKNEDLRAIAQTLGVAHLLEGSVRKEGRTLRITAQLIDGKDGAHLWSKTYDRGLDAVFAMQEEIARDVTRALSVRLDVGEMSRARGGTNNVEAFDRYLQARRLVLQGSLDDQMQAAQLLREALRLDPQFVRGWLTLSTALFQASILGPAGASAPLQGERADAMQRIARLAPESAEAQMVRLNELVVRRRWAEAEAVTSQLLKTSTPTADILLDLSGNAGFLASTGRFGEIVRLLQQAKQLEPLSMVISVELQRALFAVGQYDAAQAENERSRKLPGDWSRSRGRALLLELRRDPVDARKVQGLLETMGPEESLALPGLPAFATLGGDKRAMLALLRRDFDATRDAGTATSIVLMQVSDVLGDPELALAALERAVRQGAGPGLFWVAPVSGMRSGPRFKKLLIDSGVSDYFRSTGNWGDFCKPAGATDFECH
jgi:TolB-like protein/tetratricopeptide (TPR) repeat protein